MTSNVRNYTFTAFSADDLLKAGDAALNCGDQFVMPAVASLCVSVRDNDWSLSGDSNRNENANDTSYQTATITNVAGDELGNGRQIYAENYHWVSDQDGNWYVLIEIEQEGVNGSRNDYFTFYTGGCYSIPPEGAVLTVHGASNVCGDWLKYCDMDGGEKGEPEPEPGKITGRFFLDEDGDATEWNGDDSAWEQGVAEAVVQLLDASGAVVATTTTDGYGTYSFEGVTPGDYRVKFFSPEGYEFVQKDVGAPGEDSDANADGTTDLIHVSAGAHIRNIDAGIVRPLAIDAVDDTLVVLETEGAGEADLNVLANDTSDFGPVGTVLKVEGQTAAVGEWIALAGGGRVRLDANGELDFDANGDFDALNAGESATVSLTYTIAVVETTPPSYQCLDFNHLSRGTIVTNQFAAAGLTVTSGTPGKPVMIFDTANPTGGDWDLRTTNLGKALIISEDGDSSDPDDNAGGGTFVFNFDRPATITSLTFLDTEEPVPQMRFYDENGALITTIMGPVTADNGQGVAHFNVTGAARMEVQLQGSGAIDNLVYSLPGVETLVTEDTATVTIIIEGVDDPNAPPVAAADFIAIDEDGAIAPETTTALNVLENDSDPEGGPLIVSAVAGGAVGAAMAVTTANGVEISVTLDANGDLRFDTGADFDSLAVGESDSFTLTYTAMDDAGLEASATVTVVIDGLNEPPVAMDDSIVIGETESIGAGGAFALNLLDNDSDPNADALAVSAVEGEALDGSAAVATVTTTGGRVVDVTIAADGTVTFETAGAFDDLNEGESDMLSLSYTVSDGNGGQDDATLTITINGEGSATPAVSYNVIFLVDASASLVGTSGAGATIIGSAGPLDLNGDGIVNSEYDAALLTVQKITDKFAELGLVDVEIGVATFDSELQAIPAPAVRLSDAFGATVFGAGANLSSAFAGSGGDGFAFYDTAIAAANGFFAATTGNDQAATVNLVYLLTDGTGLPGALGAELATLATFGATLDALVVDQTAAGSPLVFAMEAAAGDGAASVLDSELAVSSYIAALGDSLIV